MKKTLNFTLKVEVELTGQEPDEDVLIERFIHSLDEAMPSVAIDEEGDDDDGENGYAVFVNSWSYEYVVSVYPYHL